MAPLSDNPFAGLTAIVAPAILTNATTVLSLSTTNRIGRVVDRSRALAGTRPTTHAGPVTSTSSAGCRRARLLLGALRFFYLSIASFAAAALLAIVGSIALGTAGPYFPPLAVLALLAGVLGVGGLVVGCTTTVREVRLALRFLEQKVATVPPPTPRPAQL